MMYSVAPRNARGSGACVPGCVPGAFPTVPVRKIVPTLRVPCGFTQLLPVSILVHAVSILSFPACAQKYCLHSSPILCALGVAFRIQILLDNFHTCSPCVHMYGPILCANILSTLTPDMVNDWFHTCLAILLAVSISVQKIHCSDAH